MNKIANPSLRSLYHLDPVFDAHLEKSLRMMEASHCEAIGRQLDAISTSQAAMFPEFAHAAMEIAKEISDPLAPTFTEICRRYMAVERGCWAPPALER